MIDKHDASTTVLLHVLLKRNTHKHTVVLVEMFKAYLVMIQRKSANPYARKTEKGPRPGGAVKAPAYSSQPHLNSDC